MHYKTNMMIWNTLFSHFWYIEQFSSEEDLFRISATINQSPCCSRDRQKFRLEFRAALLRSRVTPESRNFTHTRYIRRCGRTFLSAYVYQKRRPSTYREEEKSFDLWRCFCSRDLKGRFSVPADRAERNEAALK